MKYKLIIHGLNKTQAQTIKNGVLNKKYKVEIKVE